MTDNSVSGRLFLSAVAAAPAAPVLVASDRIAIFDPPPDRVRIVVAEASFVVPPPAYTPAEIQQIKSASSGKPIEFIHTTSLEELYKALPEADVVFGALNAEMLSRAKNLRWLQAIEAGVASRVWPGGARWHDHGDRRPRRPGAGRKGCGPCDKAGSPGN